MKVIQITLFLKDIYEKNRYYLLVSIIVFTMASCENTSKIQELKEEINRLEALLGDKNIVIDDVYKELDDIQQNLNIVIEEEEQLQNSESISKEDALTKVNKLADLITKYKEESESLKKQIQNNSSKPGNQLAVNEINNIDDKLAKMEMQNNLLKIKIESLEDENFNLKEVISTLEESLEEKEETINLQREEIENVTLEVQRLNEEKHKLAEELVAEKIQLAEFYFVFAEDLLEDVKTGLFSNKSNNSELMKKAMDFYEKAARLGNEEAKLQLESIKKDKKYSKLLN